MKSLAKIRFLIIKKKFIKFKPFKKARRKKLTQISVVNKKVPCLFYRRILTNFSLLIILLLKDLAYSMCSIGKKSPANT